MEIRSSVGLGCALSEGSGLMMLVFEVAAGVADGVDDEGGGVGGGDEAVRFLEIFSAREVAVTDVDLCFFRTGPS